MDNIVKQINEEIHKTLHIAYFLDTYVLGGIHTNSHSEIEKSLEFSEKIKPIQVVLDGEIWHLHYINYNGQEEKLTSKYYKNIKDTYSTSYSFTTYFSKYYNINNETKYINIRKIFK